MVDEKRRAEHRRSSSGASYSSNSNGNKEGEEKELQCWASIRAVLGRMMVPTCCGASNTRGGKLMNSMSMMAQQGGSSAGAPPQPPLTSSVVTGTIFGQRKGRVNFCVQEDPASPPLLLLQFAIPTHLLVKEMQSGLLRITLECDKRNSIAHDPLFLGPASLFSEPVWSMYCNGRKVGFAMKKTSKSDSDPAISNLICLMQSVTSGAGVIPCRSNSNKHDLVGTLVHNNKEDGSPLATTNNKEYGAIFPTNKDATIFPSKDGNKDGASFSNKDGIILPNNNKYNVVGNLVKHKDGLTLPHMSDGVDSTTYDGGVTVANKVLDNVGGDKRDSGGGNSLLKHDFNAGISLVPNIGLVQDDLIDALSLEKSSKEDDDLIYMRANYERVVGSIDSEAFHMINPDGSQCQELSIFLTRS